MLISRANGNRHSRECGNPGLTIPNTIKQPAVYILASQRNGTLYVGVTSNPQVRVAQHRAELNEGFTKEHGVHMLVHYELFAAMLEAITCEKQLKKWKRVWKLELIEAANPDWRDLWDDINS